ncbi:anchored repeat ABC transporter, substrate-binding protein [Patulibacter sp. S7RM1-6]
MRHGSGRLAGRTLAVAAAAVLAGCGGAAGIRDTAEDAGDDGRLTIVTTTPILADLVRQVGGDRVRVSSLVPEGGDPHSYEPTPADAARVARADATFTNHLLLEEHALIKTIDANAPKTSPNVSLAEASETYGAHVMPLVENIGLDVIWLGLRVRGDGKQLGATRASDILLTATKATGPGDITAYLTESLGQPDVYFASRDGFDAKTDTTTLPPAAHTHLNWAFSKPGVYTLTLQARLRNNGKPAGKPLASGTFRFAVGVNPRTVDVPGTRTVLDDGHTDLTVDLDKEQMYAYSDIRKVGEDQLEVSTRDVVIDVPNRAITRVPKESRFRFLGQPGARIFQLPQAVLGKHVHGEIDPHLWEDVQNAKAYAQIIRDTLKKEDPAHADEYDRRGDAYVRKLDETDRYVRGVIGDIPQARRQLITTHDAFGYLADAYGMTIAGFVVPNPAQEPSVDQIRTLNETIENLKVPAVFMEPNLAQRATVLQQVARDHGIEVCKLYGDAFDDEIHDYVSMMRFNARELRRCLGGRS